MGVVFLYLLCRDYFAGEDIMEMFSGQPFPAAVTSMNAYYGAGPVVRALDMGAEIIITGQGPRHGGGNYHHRSGPSTWGRK